MTNSTAGLALLAGRAFGGEVDDLHSRIDALRARIDQLEQQAVPAYTKWVVVPADATRQVLPGSFQLPGSDTSYSIRGYTKLDLVVDIDQTIGDSANWTTIQPNGSAAQRRGGPQFRLHARESRLVFETRTPTSYGPLHTYIQGDFLGAGGDQFRSNSSPFRLRHAFGELGPVLAGQDWSNFMDHYSLSETLDADGPAGQSDVRQGQIRYTSSFGKWTLSGSIENPQGDVAANTGVASAAPIPKVPTDPVNNVDRMPDITAKAAHNDTWGHLSVSGIIRRFETENGGGNDSGRPPNQRASVIGGGGLVGGVVHVASLIGSVAGVSRWLATDDIGFQGLYGSGIGRYADIGGGTFGSAVVKSFGTAAVREETQAQWGGFAWYQHYWTDELRSNLVYGIQRQHISSVIAPSSAAVAGGLSERIQTVHANLIWSPVRAVNLGIEGMWGERKFPKDAVTGLQQMGDAVRVQASAQYLF